jgi:transmembrane sensor
MNSADRHFSSTIEEQAALWAARLDGSTLTAPDRAALDAWLAENPTHRTALSHYCQFSADLEEQLLALVATGGVTLPPEAEKPAPRAAIFKWAALTTLAAAASVAFGVWLARPAMPPESFSTPVAQRQSLTLADGTRVELNARTSLVVENGRAERRVRLATGEAFFTVSKDQRRPFIVETPAGSVRVTGTIFDVRTEGTSVLEVTVVEGSVQVHTTVSGEHSGALAPTTMPLVAGHRLSASASGVAVATLEHDALDDALAWRRGQIVCDGMSLGEAAARLAHYHGRQIVVAPEAAVLSVSGLHSLDDLDTFFADLKVMFPGKSVSVTYDPSGTAHLDVRSDR